MAGRLHDIGKIGVPNAVLQKPGPLGADEMAQVRTHPEIGAEVLAGQGLEDLRSWVVAHHERPDGKGYPARLTDAGDPARGEDHRRRGRLRGDDRRPRLPPGHRHQGRPGRAAALRRDPVRPARDRGLHGRARHDRAASPTRSSPACGLEAAQALGLTRHRGPGRACCWCAGPTTTTACPACGGCRPRRCARASRSATRCCAWGATSSAWRSSRSSRSARTRPSGPITASRCATVRARIVAGRAGVPAGRRGHPVRGVALGRARASSRPRRGRVGLRARAAARPRLWLVSNGPRHPRARALAVGPGRGALARRRVRAAGRGRAAGRRGRRRAARARLAGPRRDGHAAGRLARGGRPAGARPPADALGAAPARGRRLRQPDRALRRAHRGRPLAGRAAAPAGSRPGPTAGRSAPAARSTWARAPPRRSRASCTRSGSSSREQLSVEALLGLPNGWRCWSGSRPSPDAADPVPDHEHDEWAWWPADVDDVAGRGRRAAAPDGADCSARRPSGRPGSSRRSRPCRSSRSGSWRGTAGGSPRRSRAPARPRSPS